MNFSAVLQLIEARAQENQRLEFKRSAALDINDSAKRAELVKDVTGMANAAGGTIIYGIVETKLNGVACATELDSAPIDGTVTADRINQVITSNTGPVLSGIEVIELRKEDQDGRIIVIEIEPAYTAHQSSLDRKYFQRIGARVEAMLDFQVRDVMARRTAAVLDVQLKQKFLARRSELHQYSFEPSIENIGQVTLDRWTLEVDIPAAAFLEREVGMPSTHDISRRYRVSGDGQAVVQHIYGSHLAGVLNAIHPGQKVTLGQELHLPEVLRVQVNDSIYYSFKNLQPPLEWRLYIPNGRPIVGRLGFEDWCKF